MEEVHIKYEYPFVLRVHFRGEIVDCVNIEHLGLLIRALEEVAGIKKREGIKYMTKTNFGGKSVTIYVYKEYNDALKLIQMWPIFEIINTNKGDYWTDLSNLLDLVEYVVEERQRIMNTYMLRIKKLKEVMNNV